MGGGGGRGSCSTAILGLGTGIHRSIGGSPGYHTVVGNASKVNGLVPKRARYLTTAHPPVTINTLFLRFYLFKIHVCFQATSTRISICSTFLMFCCLLYRVPAEGRACTCFS